jgi:hypothetical protein
MGIVRLLLFSSLAIPMASPTVHFALIRVHSWSILRSLRSLRSFAAIHLHGPLEPVLSCLIRSSSSQR